MVDSEDGAAITKLSKPMENPGSPAMTDATSLLRDGQQPRTQLPGTAVENWEITECPSETPDDGDGHSSFLVQETML